MPPEEGQIESSAATDRRVLHDPLTDLPNRTLFFNRLELALARLRRRGSKVAVLFIDLDHFKDVNDSLGHSAGDKLLVDIALRLGHAVRPSDTIARFGGDEFVVLCEDIAEGRDAMMVAQRILTATALPVLLQGREMYVTASVGIAMAVDESATPETLLRDADAAMYRAKERGRGLAEMFDDVMRARIVERLDIEQGLRRALARGELRVFYQPEISMHDDRIIGVEALVRWEHPDRGLLEPADFVHIAEETGTIVEIGEWVLMEACRQVAEWRAADTDIEVSVNLSARQLVQADLAEVVHRALEESGLPPQALCLEVREDAIMRDPRTVLAALTSIKALGVKVAIDDFGVGVSSLAQLKELLPIHALKVDPSFVHDLAEDENSSRMVEGVVRLATSLGVTAVAEGVETEDQVDRARALGCDALQGYFFRVPGPADEVGRMLNATPV
jgi:diguanylate cyclase (GGDEF)-like protein